jgi:hypothetical protein
VVVRWLIVLARPLFLEVLLYFCYGFGYAVWNGILVLEMFAACFGEFGGFFIAFYSTMLRNLLNCDCFVFREVTQEVKHVFFQAFLGDIRL